MPPPDTESRPAERRLFSDQLMMEMAQLLIRDQRLTRPKMEELNARRALTGGSFDRLLVKEGILPESEVLATLARVSGFPFRPVGEVKIQPEAVIRVPARVALRYQIMPLTITGGTITLATSEVPTLAVADSLRMLLNLAVDWVLCTRDDITKSIKHFYGLGADTIDTLVEASGPAELEVSGTDVSDTSADAGIVKFVNQILAEAIDMGATDVHIEPFENALRVRYRIDGLLQVIPVPPSVARLSKSIASCIKIMAELNIAEKRKPHDGRIKIRNGNDEFDLRVSILPTPFGETTDLRILNRKTMFIDLEHLGLASTQMMPIRYLSSLPHGVILLTGPTGSGKTTTLYALLNSISTEEVKIITVEDPIEYQMTGISQIQVNAPIGLTFASILRSILRHNPDIILVGEIRDMETADIAVRSSLTGHLVFSTLHTNDAPSAITRLADMEVEPYLIASCLEGVIAQRLVRKICASCGEPVTVDETILAEMAEAHPDRKQDIPFLKGRGCPHCNFTGYRGRMALFEIMVMNDQLRDMVVHKRPSNEIRHQAIADGLITLRKDGWSRVLDGITTVEEVIRVARKVELPPSKAPLP